MQATSSLVPLLFKFPRSSSSPPVLLGLGRRRRMLSSSSTCPSLKLTSAEISSSTQLPHHHNSNHHLPMFFPCNSNPNNNFQQVSSLSKPFVAASRVSNQTLSITTSQSEGPTTSPLVVVSFYKFVDFPAHAELRKPLKNLCEELLEDILDSFADRIAKLRLYLTDKMKIILEKIQKDQKVSLHRLAKQNKPELHVLLFGVFAVMFTGMISTLYEPPSKLPKDSRFWALMFVALGIVSLVASQARSYFFSVAGCKLIKHIRSMCFKKVVYMDISWFDEPEHSTGARLSADATTVCSLVGDTFGLLVENIATLITTPELQFYDYQ